METRDDEDRDLMNLETEKLNSLLADSDCDLIGILHAPAATNIGPMGFVHSYLVHSYLMIVPSERVFR